MNPIATTLRCESARCSTPHRKQSRRLAPEQGVLILMPEPGILGALLFDPL